MKKWYLKMISILTITFVVMFAGVMTKAEAATPFQSYTNTNEWDVVKIVNKNRIKQKQEPMSVIKDLQECCDVRVNDIITSFSHTRPNGNMWSSVIQSKGIFYMAAGENIAAGQTDADDVMNSWMNSPGHKANILGERYAHIGVGYKTGGAYRTNWVQLFVGGCSIEDIALDSTNVATYDVGTSIGQMNRYLVLTCPQHGKSYMPIIPEMCSGYSSSKQGKQTISVKCYGKTLEFSVQIRNSNGSNTENGQKVNPEAPSNQKESIGTAPGKIKGVKISKIKSNRFLVKWSRKKCTGYEIYLSTKKNSGYKKVKTIRKSTTNSYTIKNLKSKKRYYVKVRAFQMTSAGVKYGTYSSQKSVQTK